MIWLGDDDVVYGGGRVGKVCGWFSPRHVNLFRCKLIEIKKSYVDFLRKVVIKSDWLLGKR